MVVEDVGLNYCSSTKSILSTRLANKSPELSMADYRSRVGAIGGLVAAIQHEEEIREPDPPVSAIVKPEIVATTQGEDPETGPVVRALQGGGAAIWK